MHRRRALSTLPHPDDRGQTYDIRQPEMIMVGRTSVSVYTALAGDLHEAWHDLPMMLMETVEPLNASIPA